MGTSEFYRVVEEMPEVLDSLVVDTGELGERGRLRLFMVLRDGVQLDEIMSDRVKETLRTALSPRHVPDEIYAIPENPMTLNGKKLEVPVKRVLMGIPLDKAVSINAVSNPDAFRFFLELAESLNPMFRPDDII